MSMPHVDNIVHVNDLSSWQEQASLLPRQYECTKDDGASQARSADYEKAIPTMNETASPFPFRKDLNEKIVLWFGPIWKLQVDAIVNSTSLKMRDDSEFSQGILEAAGEEFRYECERCEGCKTGEAISTPGGRLYVRRVIHTAAPRYNDKYSDAARTSLHSCYFNCLTLAKEEKLRSVAFSCIYKPRKDFPRIQAAHLAIRTIRRFLEHWPNDFQKIIVCMDSSEDLDIYDMLLPLYFPRSELEEKKARPLIPEDIGGKNGEPIIEDRMIRISETFVASTSTNQSYQKQESFKDIATKEEEEKFCRMVCSPDEERLRTICKEKGDKSSSDNAALEAQIRYDQYLKKAVLYHLRDIEALNLIYEAGQDNEGDSIIAYIGCNLPVDHVNLDRVLYYIIAVMDKVREKPFNIVFMYTNLQGENQPPIRWINELFKTLSTKYHANLKWFYIVHGTQFLRMTLWALQPFIKRSFYNKIIYLKSTNDLSNIGPPILLPASINRYESTLHSRSSGKENHHML